MALYESVVRRVMQVSSRTHYGETCFQQFSLASNLFSNMARGEHRSKLANTITSSPLSTLQTDAPVWALRPTAELGRPDQRLHVPTGGRRQSSGWTPSTHSGHMCRTSLVMTKGVGTNYHYDDKQVSCIDEVSSMQKRHQRNGYIFFYISAK